VIVLLAVVLAMLCVGTVGLIQQLCALLGWSISTPAAVGIFMVVLCLYGEIRKGKRK
jgi:hypothetical protein